MVPIVAFDQIYSFDRDSLIKSIPRPEKTPAKEFAPAAEELFDRLMQMTDNAGATGEHRALNYLAVRIPCDLRDGRRCLRPECVVDGGGCTPVIVERNTQYCRCDVFLHEPQYGRG